MITISNEINNNKEEFLISIVLISIPIIFLVGSSLINLSIVLIDLYFLYALYKNNDYKHLNNKYFYALIIFWLYLLLNLIFSIDFEASIPRSIGFIRFILFAFAISYFLNKKSEKVRIFIFNSWMIIFLFISTDLLFEYIFGYNFFGLESPMRGRLGGVMSPELKIGHFYSAFILICLVNFHNIFLNSKYSENKNFFSTQIIFYILILVFIIISLLIGERSNFIKVFLMCVILFFLIDKKNFYKKFIYLLLLITFIFSTINAKPYFKHKFWFFLNPLASNPVETVLNSKYGSHYKVAVQVFQNNKYFGVGLRNYRLEVTKDKYYRDASIHPHQIHFEILAELGLVGYLIFISIFFFIIFNSIKLYILNKDKFLLCGILFISISLIPLLPSGSFFTTYGAALFWFNFSFILPRKNKLS